MPSFKSEALLPLFEAIVNAIQAIEETGALHNGEVCIDIHREPPGMFGSQEALPVSGFAVTDNGIGFDDENFESFYKDYTTHKLAKGGKGVGRFLWLKAFASVEITSVFESAEIRLRRDIHFSIDRGVDDATPKHTTDPRGTKVQLLGFKKEYSRLPTAYKTTTKIAQRVLEHCLSYFVADKAPHIVVRDGAEAISLNDLFEQQYRLNIAQEERELNGQRFSLVHIKLFSTHDKMHNIALCADYRDVKSISLTKALGTSTQFDDADQRFVYALYVSSPYLDKHVNHYRQDFDLPEEGTFFANSGDVSMAEVMADASAAARTFLEPYLTKTRLRKEERVADYISGENPALRAVPVYCPEVYDELEPTSPPEKIDEVLYRHKGKAEFAIRQQSADLLKTQVKSLDEIDESYRQLTDKIQAFQKDNLTNYLCDRKRIIDILDRKLQLNADGKYANEDIVHDIIFPRKTTSDLIRFEDHNLWLIDELLAFHAFAASEKPLNQTIHSGSEERPDVLAFAEVGEDRIARAVSILEFKKPQRTHFDEDPTKQLYRYLRETRAAKKVKLPNGRDLNVSNETRYYCYAICDSTPAIKEFAENNNYAPLMGELGYYAYNRNHNAHTEILSFDKLVVDAKRRHRAFFDKLGLA